MRNTLYSTTKRERGYIVLRSVSPSQISFLTNQWFIFILYSLFCSYEVAETQLRIKKEVVYRQFRHAALPSTPLLCLRRLGKLTSSYCRQVREGLAYCRVPDRGLDCSLERHAYPGCRAPMAHGFLSQCSLFSFAFPINMRLCAWGKVVGEYSARPPVL